MLGAFPNQTGPVKLEDDGRTTTRMGRGELIDHILVSHGLATHLDSADTTSDVPSISSNPAERRDEPGSDHAMVFARFDLA